jgi:hypothetical protein
MGDLPHEHNRTSFEEIPRQEDVESNSLAAKVIFRPRSGLNGNSPVLQRLCQKLGVPAPKARNVIAWAIGPG